LPEPEKAMQVIGAPRCGHTEAWGPTNPSSPGRDEAAAAAARRTSASADRTDRGDPRNANDKWQPRGHVWEEMLKHSDEVGSLEVETGPRADDVARPWNTASI